MRRFTRRLAAGPVSGALLPSTASPACPTAGEQPVGACFGIAPLPAPDRWPAHAGAPCDVTCKRSAENAGHHTSNLRQQIELAMITWDSHWYPVFY
jgi:hypothetical protein